MKQSKPPPRSDIDDAFAGFQFTKRKGIAHAREGLDRGVRHRVNDGVVVAQPLGQRSACVEVELAVRIGGDLPVFVFHFFTERNGVDWGVSSIHRCLLDRCSEASRINITQLCRP